MRSGCWGAKFGSCQLRALAYGGEITSDGHGDRHPNLKEAGYKHQGSLAPRRWLYWHPFYAPPYDLNANSPSVLPSRPACSVALEERAEPTLRTSQTCV